GRVEWKHHFARIANALAADPAAAAAASARQDAISSVLSAGGWSDLAAVTAPLTLIRGDHGYITADEADDFGRRLPEASIVVVPTGHNVQEEIPGELGRMLRERARKG
ncbi:MAG: alpha/beta hydrolase, partial [Microbacterium sp.]|nr:alpha/beta hydrolase [Microbacterium sp.]